MIVPAIVRSGVQALRDDAFAAWQRHEPDALVSIAAYDKVLAVLNAYDADHYAEREARAEWLDANPYALP